MKKTNLTQLFVIVVLFFTSCKKDNSATKPGSTTTTSTTTTSTTITSTYYLKGTLNGQDLIWQVADGPQDYVTGSSSSLSRAQGVTTGGLTALLSASTGLQPQLGIEFRTLQVDYTQDYPTYFNAFVNTGTWVYAANNNYTAGAKAIAIYYTDAQGKAYSSIGSQTGSSANVASVTAIPAQLGSNESLKIKLTFSCKLYPADGTGSTLSITNADATVLLEDLLY
jgi:hypothetical protein